MAAFRCKFFSCLEQSATESTAISLAMSRLASLRLIQDPWQHHVPCTLSTSPGQLHSAPSQLIGVFQVVLLHREGASSGCQHGAMAVVARKHV